MKCSVLQGLWEIVSSRVRSLYSGDPEVVFLKKTLVISEGEVLHCPNCDTGIYEAQRDLFGRDVTRASDVRSVHPDVSDPKPLDSLIVDCPGCGSSLSSKDPSYYR